MTTAMHTRSAWRTRGYVELPDIVHTGQWDRLHREAMRLWPQHRLAHWARERGVAKFRDGSFGAPATFVLHPGGPELNALHTSAIVMDAVREATDITQLVPYQCSYNYYRRGDYLGLHRDGIKATITFTFGLTDNLDPMGFAPSLATATNDELEALVAEIGLLPKNYEELPVRLRGVQGFAGYDVPHWRHPFQDELGILGTFSYFDLGNDHLVGRQ